MRNKSSHQKPSGKPTGQKRTQVFQSFERRTTCPRCATHSRGLGPFSHSSCEKTGHCEPFAFDVLVARVVARGSLKCQSRPNKILGPPLVLCFGGSVCPLANPKRVRFVLIRSTIGPASSTFDLSSFRQAPRTAVQRCPDPVGSQIQCHCQCSFARVSACVCMCVCMCVRECPCLRTPMCSCG